MWSYWRYFWNVIICLFLNISLNCEDIFEKRRKEEKIWRNRWILIRTHSFIMTQKIIDQRLSLKEELQTNQVQQSFSHSHPLMPRKERLLTMNRIKTSIKNQFLPEMLDELMIVVFSGEWALKRMPEWFSYWKKHFNPRNFPTNYL